MANREETPKASLIAQAPPRKRLWQLGDIGAVRDPDEPHGRMVLDVVVPSRTTRSEECPHSD